MLFSFDIYKDMLFLVVIDLTLSFQNVIRSRNGYLKIMRDL